MRENALKTRPMSLSPEEIERYARHLVLREVGGPGQLKLRRGCLVVGAGGLGAPLLNYLAAAGVGTLGIVDDDDVALSNLQRQVIHGARRRRPPKEQTAQRASRGSTRMWRVEPHPLRLDADNARALVRRL